MNFFCQGFYELIPQHLLRPFDERELELVLGGLGKIDIGDWKRHTKLKHCSQDSNIVKWFWKAIESFDEEKRARLDFFDVWLRFMKSDVE